MIYSEKVKIGLKNIGKQNKINNIGILEFLENVASYHSDLVGYGANNVFKTGIVWILLDWKLRVIKRPTYGDILTVNTWASGAKKFFTYRDYEIYDDKNNLCAIATSKWALIDINQRKIQRITQEIINPYEQEEKRVFLNEELDKINLPKSFISSIEYKVTRKDIDINNHMHNLCYLDLAYEALPEEVYNQKPFDNVRIMYKKEIQYKDNIKCHYTKQENKHIVVIDSNDGNTLHAIIELSK